MLQTLRASLVSLSLVVIGIGCGGNVGSISGEVTFENQPVEDGRIEFLPTDGKGQPVGADIKKGRYKITGVVPGPKIAQISAVKAGAVARSTQELADAAKKGGQPSNEPVELIPANAEGNNSTVEVTAGTQTLNFSLKKKAGT